MIFGLRTFLYAPKAFFRNLWRVITFQPVLVHEDVRLRRLRICAFCEHHDGFQCDICTCFIELKIQFTAERCPDKPPRW